MTSETSNRESNVHCLVHPWFDSWEHLEFEANIHAYIDYIALKTNDVLLIVTDWENFDLDQLKEFALMDIIDYISLYLSLNDWGLWSLTKIYDENWNFNQILNNQGLSEEFYHWCKWNIDMTELDEIAKQWKELEEYYFSNIRNTVEHDARATDLREKESLARWKIDISSIAHKALDELWPVGRRRNTHRNIRNRWRFFRIHQHAINSLGKERMRELFINDGEDSEILPIQPVSHFRNDKGVYFPTNLYLDKLEWEDSCVYNQSEEDIYGNAAKLKDDLTYWLSVSRSDKLKNQQAENILDDMWVNISSETKFVFLWEYRNRCVNNVLRVLNYRIKAVEWDKCFVANDTFTLEKHEDSLKNVIK